MIWIIALPFGALIIAIITACVMRGVRRTGEIRSGLSTHIGPASMRRPSDEFHDQVWLPQCRAIAQAAIVKMNRPLLPGERKSIWRARSPLILEVLLKEIEEASDADAVASLIESLPPGMDRPDPTGWVEGG